MLDKETFVNAARSGLDVWHGVAASAFDGIEKFNALNLEAAKSSLADAGQAGLAALAARDLPALVALQAGLLKPLPVQAAAYVRRFWDIASTTRGEIGALLAEQAADAQSSALAAFDAVARNAPEGAGQSIALLKSAVVAANDAIDGVQRATCQATETAQAGLVALTDSVVTADDKTAQG